MAYRATIALQRPDSSLLCVYLHDGRLYSAGRALYYSYRDPAKVAALVALGGLSHVGPRIGSGNSFDVDLFDRGSVRAYGRDRGEFMPPALSFSLAELADDTDPSGNEFAYVFSLSGRWLVYAVESPARGFAPLTRSRVGSSGGGAERWRRPRAVRDGSKCPAPGREVSRRVRRAADAASWLLDRFQHESDEPFLALRQVERWCDGDSSVGDLHAAARSVGAIDDAPMLEARIELEQASPAASAVAVARAVALLACAADRELRGDSPVEGEYGLAARHLRRVVGSVAAGALGERQLGAADARADAILDPDLPLASGR